MIRMLEKFKIAHVPIKPALLVRESDSLESALKAMREQRIGAAITLNAQKNPTGIFTERDFLHKVVSENVSWKQPISDFTSKGLIVMSVDQPLVEAFETMKKNKFRHVPVQNAQGDIRGVLSIRCIIRLVAEHFPEDILNLPPHLKQNPSSREGG